MAGGVFSGRIARRRVHAGRLVRNAEETILESACMDLWSGVDRALYHDGRGGMAGVETRRLRCAPRPVSVVPRATLVERGVDTAVFRPAPAGLRLRRNRIALAGDCRDARRLPAAQPRRSVAARSLPGVGQL